MSLSTASTASFTATSMSRFHGVLTTSKNRVIKNQLFNFLSYLYYISPPNRYILIIVEIWRFSQWIFQSFVPGNRYLYPLNSERRKFVGVLSIFNHIIPYGFLNNENKSFYMIFCLIYLGIFFIFFIIFFVSMYFFNKNSLIPKPLSIFIVHFFETFWVLLQPILMSISGDQIGLAFIHNNYRSNYSGVKDPIPWFFFFLTLIFYVLISIFHHLYISVSLTFRPMSLPVFNHNLETSILQLTSITSFITSILPHCGKIGRIVLYVFVFISYILPFGLVPICGNFLTGVHSSIFYSLSSTGAIITIINLVFEIIGKEMNTVVFLFEAIILIIFLVIFAIMKKKSLLKSLIVLDRIADSPKTFDDEISNVFTALLYAGVGFASGNPFVCNWNFMDMIVDRWPLVSFTWMLYARFAACFTDENSKLQWIDDKFKRKVYPTESVQLFHSQILYLIERRDASLSAQLKKKQAECQRLTSSCRSKMRLYWESVLQGNPFDMEATAISAQNANEAAQSKIMHFLALFPNNQYLTQYYLQFLIGIKADPTELKQWSNNLNLLKSGQSITPDLAQQQSLYYFPYLNAVNAKKQSSGIQATFIPDFSSSQPSSLYPPNSTTGTQTTTTTTTTTTNATTLSTSSMNSSAINESATENNEKIQLLTSIRMSIYNLQIPAVRNAIITFTILFLIFFGVAFPLSLTLTQRTFNNHLDLMNMTYLSASLRSEITFLSFYCIEYISQIIGIRPNASNYLNFSNSTIFLEYDICDAILESVSNIESYLNSIRYLNVLQSQGKYIKEAYQQIFESVLEYSTCSTILHPNQTNELICSTEKKSIESAIMSSKLFGSMLVNSESYDEVIASISNEDFYNLIASSFESADYLTDICLLVDDQIDQDIKDVRNISLILGIALSVVIFICYIIAIIFIAIKFNSNKRATAKCFLMVPKHVVSNVVDKFRQTSIIENETQTAEMNKKMIQKNKQEENFLATLSSASSNRWIVYGSIIMISIFEFLVMCAAIIASVFIYLTVNNFSDFDELHSPIHNYFQIPLSKAVLAIDLVYLLAIIDHDNVLPLLDRDVLIQEGELMAYQMQNYSSAVLYGSSTANLASLLDLKQEYITDLFKGVQYDDIISLVTSINASYEIMSPSSQFYLTKECVSRTFVMAKEDNVSLVDQQNKYLWTMTYANYYHQYVKPTTVDITKTTFNDFNKIQKEEIILYAFLYLIAIFFYFLSIIKIMIISSNIKWIISTMLQFSPDVLLNSDSVMRIISGSFKEAPFTVPQYSEKFFEKLTNDCEDALLITSIDTEILWASKSSEKIFNQTVNELKKRTFRQILVGSAEANSIKLHDQSIDEFFTNLDTALSGRKTLSFSHMVKFEDRRPTSQETANKNENNNDNNSNNNNNLNEADDLDDLNDSDENVKYLNIKLTAFSKNGVVKSMIQAKGKLTNLSFLCQDMTNYIKTSQILAKNQERVDKMITEIVPVQVLPYIHRNEALISFVEQSASFICLTIADFDLTVSSISSSQTMSILSRVLSEFDSILNSSERSIIKMRTFGDTYVAAGGFFSDIAIHPMQHAKECVKFGIECIDKISEITKNLGIQLKLKIGVNTGGPVIVGILQTKLVSPTLNIIGSAFDVAYEIMNSGEPMNVVITESVYENVYMGSFVYRQGPIIMTSAGKKTTYLVSTS